MPLGMVIGLGPGDFVLDGNPAPPAEKRHSLNPIFGTCLLWANGWMDEDVSWYGIRPGPRPHCVRWGPSSPWKGAQQLPTLFSAHVYCGYGRPLSECGTSFLSYAQRYIFVPIRPTICSVLRHIMTVSFVICTEGWCMSVNWESIMDYVSIWLLQFFYIIIHAEKGR